MVLASPSMTKGHQYPPRSMKPTIRRGRGGVPMSAGVRAKLRGRPPPKSHVGSWLANVELLSYAFSRLPPRQLPILGAYAWFIVYLSDKGWVDSAAMGKAGASIVGVLSMVTGLLLGYRFSTALGKWDEGKKIWVQVRTVIRDAIRLLSVPSPVQQPTSPSPPTSSQPSLLSMPQAESANSSPAKRPEPVSRVSGRGKENAVDGVSERIDELSALFVAFAFALQHHLHHTRPLPHPPLIDLLPPSYLSSLRRTEARVRFAPTHHSHHPPSFDAARQPSPASLQQYVTAEDSDALDESAISLDLDESALDRPGLRRRGTGPPTNEERLNAGEYEDDWELSHLKMKAEEAVSKLAEALAGSNGSTLDGDTQLRLQLDQLNIPKSASSSSSSYSNSPSPTTRMRSIPGDETEEDPTSPISIDGQNRRNGPSHGANGISPIIGKSNKPKSNLANPNPPNLPLSILRLLEMYACGLADVPEEKGGWADCKRDRVLALVQQLGVQLGEAERLSSTPPPLPLTLHLSHLILIYLAAIPPSLLCTVQGPILILITLIAGWCLLGLDALVSEVQGVFGGAENHHPLPLLTEMILNESLDLNPCGFGSYYRSRLVARLGENDEEVKDLDRRRKGEEWVPSFE